MPRKTRKPLWNPEYCTLSDAASRLRCQTSQVSAFIEAGELTAVDISADPNSVKRHLRISIVSLEALITKRSVKPA